MKGFYGDVTVCTLNPDLLINKCLSLFFTIKLNITLIVTCLIEYDILYVMQW